METRFRAIARLSSAFVALAALLVLAGRTGGFVVLERLTPGFLGMALNTAVAFILLGSTMAVVGLEPRKRWQSVVLGLSGVCLLALGILTLCEHAFGWNLGPEPLLYSQPAPGGAQRFPVRMAPATAFNLTLLGLAVVGFNRGRRAWIGQLLAGVVGFTGLLVVLGYAYDVESFFRVEAFAGMGLHTALGFCLLGFAYLMAKPGCGMMAIVSSPTYAGLMARWLLPPAIVLPFLFGWLHRLDEKMGLYGTGLGTALFALANILVFTSLILLFVRNVSNLEKAREKTDQILRKRNQRLTLLSAIAGDLLRADSREKLTQSLFQELSQSLPVDTFVNFMVNEQEHVLELHSCGGIPEEASANLSRLPFGKGVCGAVAQQRKAMGVAYIQDSRDPNVEMIRALGMRAYMCFPFKVEARLLGTLGFGSRTVDAFTAEDFDFAQTITDYAALAVDRLQSQEALRASQAQLSAQAARLEELVQERTAKLQETIGELEHFSYSITHDMRAPLRAMRSFADLLLVETQECLTPRFKDFLQRIASAAERMDKLIQDSLSYSKAVREQPVLKPVQPDTLLQDMLQIYPAFQIPRAHIQVVGPFPKVLANEAGLTQCFSNLLGNAVKFVPPGTVPSIRVWAEKPDSLVRIWFADNGIGIPEHWHKRIFDMFQRVSHDYEGTGVGLALVRKLVERMGGKVGVESEPGKGSRFWLELQPAPETEIIPTAA